MSICDKQGNRLCEDIGKEHNRPEIVRGDICAVSCWTLVPKEKIRWGYTLKRATLGEDGSPVLEFTNGLRLPGFKLVGTDGAWSKVRSLV